MVASYDLLPGNGAGPIFWKVRDRKRNRREGKTHKKEEGKIQIGKVSKTKIQIRHIHTAPKSTSESQAQITHLLTASEPAWGTWTVTCGDKGSNKARRNTVMVPECTRKINSR